jgi:hypothetical protein
LNNRKERGTTTPFFPTPHLLFDKAYWRTRGVKLMEEDERMKGGRRETGSKD